MTNSTNPPVIMSVSERTTSQPAYGEFYRRAATVLANGSYPQLKFHYYVVDKIDQTDELFKLESSSPHAHNMFQLCQILSEALEGLNESKVVRNKPFGLSVGPNNLITIENDWQKIERLGQANQRMLQELQAEPEVTVTNARRRPA